MHPVGVKCPAGLEGQDNLSASAVSISTYSLQSGWSCCKGISKSPEKGFRANFTSCWLSPQRRSKLEEETVSPSKGTHPTRNEYGVDNPNKHYRTGQGWERADTSGEKTEGAKRSKQRSLRKAQLLAYQKLAVAPEYSDIQARKGEIAVSQARSCLRMRDYGAITKRFNERMYWYIWEERSSLKEQWNASKQA